MKSYPGSKQFYVLRNTNMPAVLTENGFYTNKEECALLMKSEIRQKIADAQDYKVPATIDDPGILPEIELALKKMGYAQARAEMQRAS